MGAKTLSRPVKKDEAFTIDKDRRKHKTIKAKFLVKRNFAFKNPIKSNTIYDGDESVIRKTKVIESIYDKYKEEYPKLIVFIKVMTSFIIHIKMML